MSTIVLATANPHKVSELRAIFAAANIEVIGLNDIRGNFTEPEEHGTTCRDNARIKALSYATQTGRICLADDSGLEIDALGGAPGVISSHYSTDGRETGMTRPERDAANNARVLRELEEVAPEHRTARFVCCMCLTKPEQPGESWSKCVLHESRGTFEGRIGVPPRVPAGYNGFGYDPLFLVAPEFKITGAEMATDLKNQLSHRAKAAIQMAEWMRNSCHRLVGP